MAAAAARDQAQRAAHIGTAGFCVGSRLKRFLQVTRSWHVEARRIVSACKTRRRRSGMRAARTRENLSSGEKRAGCADCVGLPSGAVFCGAKTRGVDRQRMRARQNCRSGVQGRRALSVYITLPASSRYIIRYILATPDTRRSGAGSEVSPTTHAIHQHLRRRWES